MSLLETWMIPEIFSYIYKKKKVFGICANILVIRNGKIETCEGQSNRFSCTIETDYAGWPDIDFFFTAAVI